MQPGIRVQKIEAFYMTCYEFSCVYASMPNNQPLVVLFDQELRQLPQSLAKDSDSIEDLESSMLMV